ncbi:hypothetical protein [Brevibacterium sediminis]|uniref:hypothetical protein n=1 Tax=Brevibacterium sediminis TaxID=1857024 RepID=UPI001E64FC7B|nr:hypothetical protein [Brevibacterium sediminis]
MDTEANGSYAPDIVDRVRRLRAERFAFSSGGKVAGSRSCSSSSRSRWMQYFGLRC